jgi:hypothetical protein
VRRAAVRTVRRRRRGEARRARFVDLLAAFLRLRFGFIDLLHAANGITIPRLGVNMLATRREGPFVRARMMAATRLRIL